MAEFKKIVGDALKPFAKKIGSDIRSIESKVFTGKAINVVEFGIDNTGATDVTAKLNELFKKVHDENYTEVIFPDGTYKVGGTVDVTIPSDRQKYLYIHAQNRYKAKIEMHGTRETTQNGSAIVVGFRLNPENFEATTTRGYNLRFDGFIMEGHELPADGSNSQTQSIYSIYTNQDNHNDFNMSDYKLYNFTCTNMEFIGTNYSVSLYCSIFDAEFKNLHIENVSYPLDLNGVYSNNNSLDNIVFKNCENAINASVKSTVKNIDIIYDNEEVFKDNTPNNAFTPYLLSNLSIKGYYNLQAFSDILTINAPGVCTVSDIRLDLKPTNLDIATAADYIPSFISLNQLNSEAGLINVSEVVFDKFEENFANAFEKFPKFAFFSTTIPVSLHGVTETDHLKFFQEKAVNAIYEKTGSYTQSYNTKNELFKPRPYLGTDRNMNGTDQAANSTLGAIYLASSEGTPSNGKDGEDYSENTAGVRGDIFTELEPEKYGHFAYVSTFENAKDITSLSKDTITAFTYDAETKLYTATFTELPKLKDGTLKDKVVNVGSILENLDSGPTVQFEITAVDEDAKTLTLKPTIERVEGFTHPYTMGTERGQIFSYGYKIRVRKINRMKNMTYVTVPIIHSGSTENRPTEHLVVGQMYFDTTLGVPVFWNGTEWIKGNNGAEIDTSSLATKAELGTLATKAEIADLAPKSDLTTLATKNELKILATKEEVGKLAAKTDLASLATKAELTSLATKEEVKALATKAEIKSIPVANIVWTDDKYFVSKYQNAKLGNLYNRGEFDKLFVKKTDLATYVTKEELAAAIAAIPAPTVDTSTLVTKEEFNATLNAINEKLKQIRGE